MQIGNIATNFPFLIWTPNPSRNKKCKVFSCHGFCLHPIPFKICAIFLSHTKYSGQQGSWYVLVQNSPKSITATWNPVFFLHLSTKHPQVRTSPESPANMMKIIKNTLDRILLPFKIQHKKQKQCQHVWISYFDFFAAKTVRFCSFDTSGIKGPKTQPTDDWTQSLLQKPAHRVCAISCRGY